MRSPGIYAAILCALCAWPAPRTVANVVEGPITNSFTGHVFYVVTPGSWTEAQAEAHGMGGHLATIRSRAENNWVVTNLLVDFAASGGPNLSVRPLWIGLNDPTTNDGGRHAADFVWDSGETNAYRNWNPAEPSNTGNVEYFTAINWHYAQGDSSELGTWNDAPLNGSTGDGGTTDGPYYGIVEIGTGFPNLPTVPGAVYGPVMSQLNGHSYFLVPAGGWDEARASAQNLGGDLATVRSAAENEWIVANMLADLSAYGGPDLSALPLWLGLYDPSRQGETPAEHAADFVWSSGDPAAYRNWNPSTGEPSNTGGAEFYTAINWHFAQGASSDHAVWNDTPLNGTTGYGGGTDGPYYGIAEVATNTPIVLNIVATNSQLALVPSPSLLRAVLHSSPSLAPPVTWTPVWTNNGGAPYTVSPTAGSQFFRILP